MAGANYMGGRRNAAKARSRDKTGRIQKDFFGRRRLNILSKGLAGVPRSRDIVSGSSVSVTRAPIELGHAKKATVPQEDTVSVLGKRKRDIQTSSSSPSSKVSAQSGSSSTKSTKSKLLQELDIIEPYAAISCILGMNDLAGLPPSPRKRKRSDSRVQSPPAVSSHSVSDEEDDPIMEYESFEPGSCYPSSISTGSSPQSTRQCQRYDGLFLQDALETEYMRDIDYDRDQSSHCTPFRKTTRSVQAYTSRRCSGVSLSEQVSNAAREGDSSSFISVPVSGGQLVRQSSGFDGNMISFGSDVLEHSNTRIQFIDADQKEENRTNILDYSDPWEQIGVIMGLRANHHSSSEDTQMQPASQEECESAEDELNMKKQPVLESDLPPSDIIDESSLDDTLYSPSSLPIAESSESVWAPLETIVTFPQVNPEDMWEDDFDDWAVGLKESQFHNAALPSTHDILAVDGNVLNGNALIECVEAPRSHPSQEEQQYVAKDNKRCDAAGSYLFPVKDARSILAEDSPKCHSTTLKSEQTRPPEVADSAMKCEDLLAIPELLECNGVYHGPCLLSQESEPDE